MDSLQPTTAAIRRRRPKAEDQVGTIIVSETEVDLLSPAAADTNDIDVAPGTVNTDHPAQADAAPRTQNSDMQAAAAKSEPVASALTPEELKRQRRRASAVTAREQRKRHKSLLAEWMPTQRGAVIPIETVIGHQAIQSWFERTFMKRAKMLWKMHSFPKVVLTYEQVAKIEQSALDAVTKAEAKLNALMSQLDTLITQADATMAFYQGTFKVTIVVSTRTAARLHGIYKKADDVALRLETLALHGLITPERYAKGLSDCYKAVFMLCARIDQLFNSLYIRAGAEAPNLPEGDTTSTSDQGDTPHDQRADQPVAAEAVATDTMVEQPTAPASSPGDANNDVKVAPQEEVLA